MPTTLLRGITGASSLTSESLYCSSVRWTPTYRGSPARATTVTSSAGMPSSSTSPRTTPYIGSSPVVNLAIRTWSSLPAGAPSSAVYPRGCGEPGDTDPRGARRTVVAGSTCGPRGARRRLGATPPGATAGPSGPSGRGLPLHLLLPAPRGTAPLAPGVRRGARGRRGLRRAQGVRRGPAQPSRRDLRSDGLPRTRPVPGSPAPLAAHPAHRYRVTSGSSRLLRHARVGDGLRARPVRRTARLVAAPPGSCGDRRGRGAPPDRLLALRRVPVLHRRGPAAQHPLPGPRRPGGVRAAGLPPRRYGPLQARVPDEPDGPLRAGGGLLRPRPRHPRPRHARLAVRPLRPRLLPRAGGDTGGQAGVRRGAAHVRGARTSAASAPHRRGRAAPDRLTVEPTRRGTGRTG